MARLAALKGILGRSSRKRSTKSPRRGIFMGRLSGGDGVSNRSSSASDLIKSTLGIFGQAISSRQDLTIPPLDQPKRVTRESNPYVSSIVGQLDALLRTATKIGAISQEHQDTIVSKLKQAKQVEKEQQLEGGLKPNDTSGAVSPIISVLSALADKLETLTEVVDRTGDNYSTEGGGILSKIAGGAAGIGLLGAGALPYRGFSEKSKMSSMSRREARHLRKSGFTRRGKGFVDASGKFVNRATLERTLRAGPTGRPSPLGRGMARVGAGAMGLAGLIGRSAKKAIPAGGRAINNGLIQRIAKPIILKAVGKTVLKSIPIIGAVAGIGFAAKRLMEGDVVGAGLEATSGLAGPLTAIPALVATVARDTYSGVYGIQPEQDPQAGPRLAAVTTGVKSIVEDTLKDSVQPRSNATRQAPVTPPVIPRPTTQQNPNATRTPPAIPQAPTPKPAQPRQPAGGSGGGGGGGASPAPTRTPAPAASSDDIPTEDEVKAKAPPVENPYPNAEIAEKMEPKNATGAAISEASQTNDMLASTGVPRENVSGIPTVEPSTMPTSKTGAVGIGNVPDPTYWGSGSIVTQLYFKVPA